MRYLFGNVMLAGIVPAQADGQEPKNVDPYLELVVVEILDLSGVTFFDAFKEAPFTFKVDLLNYVLDYPGLEKFLHQQVQMPCRDVCSVRLEVSTHKMYMLWFKLFLCLKFWILIFISYMTIKTENQTGLKRCKPNKKFNHNIYNTCIIANFDLG